MNPTTLDAAAVLAAARRERAEADAAEARVLARALDWAHLHTVETAEEAATWGDSPIPLAGEGAPLVSAFCIADLATALHLSTESGRHLIAHALELHHRLPRLWHRVQSGTLQTWRARRVADKTAMLSPEAAEYVDRHVAPFAHQISQPAIDRLVDEAIARFMPHTAQEIAQNAADGRCVRIDHQQVSFHGTSLLQGELDLPDALDLDAALTTGAEQLKALGSEDSLDARRAIALGHLARGEQFLDLPNTHPDTERVEKPRTQQRQVVLHLHLSQAALTQGGIGRVENTSPHSTLITADQIATWCGADASKIVVKPVIDLNDTITVTAYEIPDRIREHVTLRDQHCVFPYCTRSARACDIDHILPWQLGGPTSTDNLAALCRKHHRLKTHGKWRYTMVEPGTYLWHSPHGYTFLTNGEGTQDLTPRPVDPPGEPTARV